MKLHWLIGLLFVTVFSTTTVASDAEFEQVLALARRNESSLAGPAANTLKQAQGDAYLSAIAACVPSRNLSSDETRFVIVAKLGPSGTVEQTWRQGESDLAKCFEAHLQGAEIYRPGTTPFYTYFDAH